MRALTRFLTNLSPKEQLLVMVACLSLQVMPVSGQTVAVQGELDRGFGWMFRDHGICFVIVPRHVIEGSRRVTVTSAAPLTIGTGDSILPFFPGFDLGLVRVRGSIEARCVEDFAILDLDTATRETRQAQLERLSSGGQVDRTLIRIEDFGYHSFTGVIEQDAAAVIRQGTSGAFAFVGDVPVGMAYASQGEDSAIFMRAEEIHMHVHRYISEHGPILNDTSNLTSGIGAVADGSVALRLREATRPPISPEFAPENVLGEGSYVFEPTGRAALLFELEGHETVLTRLVMSAQPGDGTALPRDVLVEVSPTTDGARFFRLGQFRMGPDGVFDTGRIAPRTARLVRLTILNVYGAGPVTLDRVAMFGN